MPAVPCWPELFGHLKPSGYFVYRRF